MATKIQLCVALEMQEVEAGVLLTGLTTLRTGPQPKLILPLDHTSLRVSCFCFHTAASLWRKMVIGLFSFRANLGGEASAGQVWPAQAPLPSDKPHRGPENCLVQLP